MEPGSVTKPGIDTTGTVIFYYNTFRDLIALEAETGKVKWRTNVVSAGSGAFGTDIAVAGDVVAVGDVDVFAFRASTGERLWRHGRALGNEGERPIATDGKYFYLAGVDGRVSKVEPVSGQDVWVASLAHGDSAVAAFGPTVVGERVFACGNRYQQGIAKGALSALNKETGELLWRFYYEPDRADRDFTRCFSQVAAISGLIVSAVGDGRIVAHDPANGTIKWTSPAEHGNESTGDFRYVASDGSVLVATSAGKELVTRLDPATGAVLWRARTPGSPLAAAQIGAGAALVSHQPPVVAYDLSNGAVLWARPDESERISGIIPYRVRSPPLVHNGVAYFVGTDGLRAKRIR
jgi:outer membrane protein assembly factor BamB